MGLEFGLGLDLALGLGLGSGLEFAQLAWLGFGGRV